MKQKPFYKLKSGRLFLYRDNIYLKIAHSEVEYYQLYFNAVSLIDGQTTWFDTHIAVKSVFKLIARKVQ